MDQEQITSDKTHFLLRMRMVSKIALIVGGVACLCMLLVLNFITDKSGVNYGTIIRSYSVSHQHLGPTLLVAGLFLVSFSGVVTYLISLYTSFRIAGPLYRFARNLEVMIEQGTLAMIPTRKGDHLKFEEQQFKQGLLKLHQHYDAIWNETEGALSQLESNENPIAAINRLKEVERAAQL